MNSTRVVILQPHFLPFIGYFDLMNRADIFVYYDTVQFIQRGWQCRTYIVEGAIARWLSLPVAKAAGSRRRIQEMCRADIPHWHTKIACRLMYAYAATPEQPVLDAIIELIRSGPSGLSDWNISANQILATALNVTTPTICASALPPVSGDRQARLIAICRELGATHYLCGPGSRFYVRDDAFAQADIRVEWIDYNYAYRVARADGQLIFPSALDMILRMGRSSTRKELRHADTPPDSAL